MSSNKPWVHFDDTNGSGANDGSSGAADGHKTGGDGFDVNSIPATVRQSLIDQGVNIGVARGKDAYEKDPSKLVEKALQAKGLSAADLDAAAVLVKKQPAIAKLLEKLGADDPDSALAGIEKHERNQMSEAERSKADHARALQQVADLTNQVSTVETSFKKQLEDAKKRETQLFGKIQDLLVTRTLKEAASSAYDPEDVVISLGKNVRVDENEGTFQVSVVDGSGNKRFSNKGQPLTIQEAVEELLTAKPHLRKSDLQSGPGGMPGKKQGETTSDSLFTKEQIKDPKFFQKNSAAIIAAVKEARVKS